MMSLEVGSHIKVHMWDNILIHYGDWLLVFIELLEGNDGIEEIVTGGGLLLLLRNYLGDSETISSNELSIIVFEDPCHPNI